MEADPRSPDADHEQLGHVAACFADHGVDFVVIGGWSIDRAFPEIGYRTEDIDLVVADTDDNYERIAATLNALEARAVHRGIPRKDPANIDADRLKHREHWRFHAGGVIIDIMSSVGIISSYELLAETAIPVATSADNPAIVLIADPKIVYASKSIAGRAKDEKVLEDLRAAIEAAEGSAGIAAIEQMEAAAEQALREGTADAIEHMETAIRQASTSQQRPIETD